jgi:chemotaxis protein histidine kinase CheA/ActR/RegA family two-component response regulator
MQPEQQQRIMGYFIEEAKDHLNTIEQALLNLQGTLDDSELANEVFRAAHSVKGGAAMLGLTGIQQTSHQLEDYFKILKETPSIRVDQKLETLLLRVFDTLSSLVEQLQTPFGLTEEVSQSALREANPVFAEVEQHLKNLMASAGATAPMSTASRSMVFQEQVPGKLRELLELFKQVDANPAMRQNLQGICGDLRNFGTVFSLPNWTMLLDLVTRAVLHPENSGRTLAVTVLKDLKDAQNQVLSDQDGAIQASDTLMSLVPLVSEPIDLFGMEETADDGFADLFDGDLGLDSGLDLDLEMGDSGSGDFDLFAEVAEDSIEDDFGDLFGGDLPDSDVGIATSEEGSSSLESLDDFEGLGDLEELDFGDLQSDDLGLDMFEAEQTALETTTQGIDVSESFDDLMMEDSGPEMGLAELNSLADLFEGEVPDLSSTWQDEEELKVEDAFLDDFDLQADTPKRLVSDRDLSLDTMSDDALDDLFSDDLLEVLPFTVPVTAESEDDLGLDFLDQASTASSIDDLDLGALDLGGLPEEISFQDDNSSDFSDLGDLFGQLDEADLPFDPSLDAAREPIVETPIEGLDLDDEDDSFSELFSGDAAGANLSGESDLAGMEDLFGSDSFADDGFELDGLSLDEPDLLSTGASPLDDVFGEAADDALNASVITSVDFLEESPTLLDLTDPDAGSDIFLDMDEPLLLDQLESETEMQFDPQLNFGSIEDPDNDWTLPGSELDNLMEAELSFEGDDVETGFDFGDADLDLAEAPESLDFGSEDFVSEDFNVAEDLNASDDLFGLDALSLDEPPSDEPIAELSEDLSLDAWDDEAPEAPFNLDALLGVAAVGATGLGALGVANAINAPVAESTDELANLSDTDLDDLDFEGFGSGDLDAVSETDLSSDLDLMDFDEMSSGTESMDLESMNFDEMSFDEMSSTEMSASDDSLSSLDFDTDSLDGGELEGEFDNLDDLLGGSDDDDLAAGNDFSDLDNLLSVDSMPSGLDFAGAAIGTGLVAGVVVNQNASSGSQVMDDPEFDDLERLLEDRDAGNTAATTTSTGVARSAALAQARRPPARASKGFGEQTMRVPVKHLDNLSNLVGELVVNRNSLEQDQERMRQSLDNLLYQVQQLSDVGQRMQDLYERSLLESSLLASRQSYRMASSRAVVEVEKTNDVEYDPLEMDRFTGFHSLSQEMIELIVRVRESASDIEFIVDETDQVTRMFRQVTTQLQEGLTRSRMVPFAQTADRMPRAVRDIAMKCGKQAELIVEGRETPIDKMLLEHLYDPMTHLVNNAITHGIETPDDRRRAGKSETGRITIRAFYQGNQTVISVSDDGAGIDIEYVKQKAIQKGLITSAEAQTMGRIDVYDLLFHPGFSTRDQADDFAGRGVGMDVVRTSLSEIRGSVTTDSTLNRGTTFTIRLPLTLSISKALCCVSDRARVAFPMDGVEDMLDMPKDRLLTNSEGEPCIRWRDTELVLRPLTELLAHNRHLGRGNVYGGNQEEDMISVVVLRSAGNYLALQVDQVIGEQEIVIKQLEGPVPKPVGIAGATVLGDGRIMPIADVLELIDLSMGRIRRDAGSMWEQNQPPVKEIQPAKVEPMVLIVDDSITVRELLSMTFNKVGYRVEQARDGQEAWEKLRAGLPCNIVFCDIEMPRMDGLELLSRIQKDPVLKALPIAMLTSRGADRHRQMASSLGASGYFTKPYLEEALLDAAARMLKGEVLLANDRE